MSDNTATLALLLDAPLQSWGDSSRFNHRGTAAFPSKSGVLGLIAAAIGIDKYHPTETERIAPLSALHFHVARLPRMTPWGPRPAHRLRDYHTIGANYDRKNPWEAGMILRNAEGKMKSVAGNPEQSHTEVTEREYLLDSRFAVILEGKLDTLQKIQTALENPVWGVWLGRKSCPPALPVVAFLAATNDEAFAQIIAAIRRHEARQNDSPQTPETARWRDFDRLEEVANDRYDQLLYDQPRSFQHREFHARPIRHHRP
ncbi:type I-E CRISPR-associated protein Cas5/CasD [Haloferula chungangensis]|uniref:Type I-E CRISPR-associated protein Cas5/CasD n=1 Tax=Haloferula chungangensis TaxID=1048331 RepID=A0ABW2L9E6_9BACT